MFKNEHLRNVPNVQKEKIMDFTNEQKDAIYKKGSNILVAAAAGSRKDSCSCGAYYSKDSKGWY